jgi:hypothetical protein
VVQSRKYAYGFKLILTVLVSFLFSSALGLPVEGATKKPPRTPALISVSPLGSRQGSLVEAYVRGKDLDGVSAVYFDSNKLHGRIKKIEQAELPEQPSKGQGPESEKTARGFRITVEVQIDATTPVGSYMLRIVTPDGISDALPFLICSEPVVSGMESPHYRPDPAQAVNLPAVINGTMSRDGATDYYAVEAAKNQELVFEGISRPAFTPSSVGNGFPVDIALYDPTGSWFDPRQVTQLANKDQSTPGIVPSHPLLKFRFPKQGRFLVGVSSSDGKGGPDFPYQLRIAPASSPTIFSRLENNSLQAGRKEWVERNFRRELEPDRLLALWSRTIRAENSAGVDSSISAVNLASSNQQAGEEGSQGEPRNPGSKAVIIEEKEPNDAPSQAVGVSIPAIIEGTIDHPNDVDSFKFKAKRGESLAFEIETPDATIPIFNPRLDVMDQNGQEFLTNIWKRISRNFSFYMKSLEPKTIYTFKLDGQYCLQIRDATFRYGDSSFKYRILVRPQVPHVGEIEVKEDHVNLVPGEATKLNVVTGQEEGFTGDIAITVEGLPSGVSAFPGTEVKPDKGPPLDEGYKERFVPKKETASIILAASVDAAATSSPQFIRVVVHPVINAAMGSPLAAKEIPLMITKQSNSIQANQGTSRPAAAGNRH